MGWTSCAALLGTIALTGCVVGDSQGDTDSGTDGDTDTPTSSSSSTDPATTDDGPSGQTDGMPSAGSSTGTSAESSSSGTPQPTTDAVTSGSEESSTGEDLSDCSDFPAVPDFGEAGPFEVVSEAGGESCSIWRPANLGANGIHHPIILWGNGTTASPPIYAGVLRHWASQGFISAAANTSNAGDGTDMLACLDWLTAQNDDASSEYADAVDLEHVGASGHSQGGGGTIMVGQDPRITVTAPLQPYTQQGFGGYDQASQSNQNGPMFMMSGSADVIAPINPNQQRVFDTTNAPLFWGNLQGGDHVFSAIGSITRYRAPATAWFRYHLMCDETARGVFYDDCSLCADAEWEVMTANWE